MACSVQLKVIEEPQRTFIGIDVKINPEMSDSLSSSYRFSSQRLSTSGVVAWIFFFNEKKVVSDICSACVT